VRKEIEFRGTCFVGFLVVFWGATCPRAGDPPPVVLPPVAETPVPPAGAGDPVAPDRATPVVPAVAAVSPAAEPNLVFGDPVVAASNTRQQAGPAIAPGAVVYRRTVGPAVGGAPSGLASASGPTVRSDVPIEERVFQRLDDEGRPQGDPVPLGGHWISPSGLTRWNDHYLLAASGSTVRLLDLDRYGREVRRLDIEAAEVTDEASVTPVGSSALVVWWNQDTTAVRGRWIDLSGWTASESFELRAEEGGWSQHPQVLAATGGARVAWGESAGGSMSTWWVEIPAGGVPGPAARLAEIAPGPRTPVGWAPVVEPVVVQACGAMTKTVAFAAPGSPVLAEIRETEFSGAVVSIAGIHAVVLEEGQQIRLRLVSSDGTPVGAARTLSESEGRHRRPSVASDGTRVWLAWERYSGGRGSDVVVRVGRVL
jgi:hypothetical protein